MWMIADWLDKLFTKKPIERKCENCKYANVEKLICQLAIDTNLERGGFFCMRTGEDREDWELKK